MQPLVFSLDDDSADAVKRLEAEAPYIFAHAAGFDEVFEELRRKNMVHHHVQHENNLGASVYHPAGIRIASMLNSAMVEWEGLPRDEVHALVQQVLEGTRGNTTIRAALLQYPALAEAVKNEWEIRMAMIDQEPLQQKALTQGMQTESPGFVGNMDLLRQYRNGEKDCTARVLLFQVTQTIIAAGQVRVYNLLRLTV